MKELNKDITEIYKDRKEVYNGKKEIIFLVLFALSLTLVTVIGYFSIKGTWPFDPRDTLDSYYCTLMIIKSFLLGINILVYAGMACMCIHKWGHQEKND